MDLITNLETAFAYLIVGAPALLVVVLGLCLLFERPLSERTTCQLVATVLSVGFISALAMSGCAWLHGMPQRTVPLGDWVVVSGYKFSGKLLFDWLSLLFLVLSFMLCGVIGRFATHYLHREPGFHRFFVLFAVFVFGMTLTSIAGTIETLFTGWELVGLSSALLVAFFQDRSAPVRNGLRVWSVYRISDAALLIGAVALHGMKGFGDFQALFGETAWPHGEPRLLASQALLVGVLFAVAAAGKSALVPFSGWLPRAMEGPTPSSAIFYGALSVHLGAFLLLRAGPLISLSIPLCVLLVVWGLATAALSASAARVQSDIKSALAFASLTQVGLIVAEIGLGLRWIPLIHMIGHASLRTLQFVRAPNLLQDYRSMENAMGRRLPHSINAPRRVLRSRWQRWFYRWALERGYFDEFLNEFIVRPFLSMFRWFDSLERRWTDFLSSRPSRESDEIKPHSDLVEEFV
ncbi:MAG: oxidoreductase [Pirellulales bacterium]|nr:oxidoreductase [Pirellulales bacterium]